jgi:hypothetical protein
MGARVRQGLTFFVFTKIENKKANPLDGARGG